MATVLLTGASGYIADYIMDGLQRSHALRLVDNRPGPDVVVRDLTDARTLDRHRDLFRGADAVVHLAFQRPEASDAVAGYLAERGNVDMAFVIYQLALEEGVRRVVVASSNHAADFYEGPLRRRTLELVGTDEPRPLADNFYGWSKEAYEHLGFVYATGALGRPLEVVQIRIGAPRDLATTSFVDDRRNDPLTLHRDLGMWISPRDLTQLTLRAIDAPDLRDRWGVPFQVVYGISGNTRSTWSLANARTVLGYVPRDDSEIVYADEIRRWIVEPQRGAMVSAEARGGLGRRV